MNRHLGESEGKGRKIHVRHGHEPEETAPLDGAAGTPDDEAVESATSEADATESEPQTDVLEKARAEAREFQDKYLRLYAETENFKKRMSRESAEREKYYNEGIIKELLPVLDNLERAIAHAGETEGGNGGLVEGVKMVRKQFVDALVRFGVKEVECVGLLFDPATQQAMMQAETDEYDEGTVMEVFQKGYLLNDRILRPAMVTVAKRPARTGEDKEQED